MRGDVWEPPSRRASLWRMMLTTAQETSPPGHQQGDAHYEPHPEASYVVVVEETHHRDVPFADLTLRIEHRRGQFALNALWSVHSVLSVL